MHNLLILVCTKRRRVFYNVQSFGHYEGSNAIILSNTFDKRSLNIEKFYQKNKEAIKYNSSKAGSSLWRFQTNN